ncbi:MAG: GTPase ObgE [Acidimicrobiales bacterium]
MAEFVDEALVCVKGGDGGAGSVSFRREAHVPKGGPDGGDGGSGGDVWFVADPQMASLLAFQDYPHRRAASGVHGQGKAKHGASAADLRVVVPVGTVVKNRESEVLADLVSPGDTWLAAAGGRGGRGNARFLSNRRRAPTFAEQGEHGAERWLKLELKLLADAALVGFPNAGKSTLISRISAAKPKVADYPFTTLRPHLGVVRGEDNNEFVVADIPGLIEGASEGKGLGHQFLRHIERARALVVLLDLGPAAERPPQEQLAVLLDELGRYQPDLLDRPRVVVGAKADVAACPWEGPRISAVTGEGITELVRTMVGLVEDARAAEPAITSEGGAPRFVVHRPEPEGVRVERDPSGALVVTGRAAERAVAVSDLTNVQALAYVQDRLRRLGVDRALARAGAREGDVVHIGAFSFEYQEDAR